LLSEKFPFIDLFDAKCYLEALNATMLPEGGA